jgi:hypothetical protein
MLHLTNEHVVFETAWLQEILQNCQHHVGGGGDGEGATFGLLGCFTGKEAGAKIHKDIKQFNV